jgi:hypothetical protein
MALTWSATLDRVEMSSEHHLRYDQLGQSSCERSRSRAMFTSGTSAEM